MGLFEKFLNFGVFLSCDLIGLCPRLTDARKQTRTYYQAHYSLSEVAFLNLHISTRHKFREVGFYHPPY